jgi:hypothetical protein
MGIHPLRLVYLDAYSSMNLNIEKYINKFESDLSYKIKEGHKKCLSWYYNFVILIFVVTRNKVLRPVGQVVKTPPFHGGNRGSSPLRVTIIFTNSVLISFMAYSIVKSSRAISSVGRAPDF